MPEVSTLFFDIGGVLLTNGWDRDARRITTDEFGLDWDEFRDRHDFVVHDFEIGRLTLEGYVERTVFYRERDFSREDFVAAMKSHSVAIEGSLELLDELAAAGLFLATLNNESRDLNEHRIESFGLRDRFQVFLSSCYLGFKKPEPEIYRLAFQLTQRKPAETLFIDDRQLNLECALDEGLNGIRFESADQLRGELVSRGVLDA